jgi:hypothetical protein
MELSRMNFESERAPGVSVGRHGALGEGVQVDGYRCDVAIRFPLDFWLEGAGGSTVTGPTW